MQTPDEDQRIDQVIDRLLERLPDIPRDHIEQIVGELREEQEPTGN